MSRIVKRTPLTDRLSEVLTEYSEANPVSVGEVLDALTYVHACVERKHIETAPADKLD